MFKNLLCAIAGGSAAQFEIHYKSKGGYRGDEDEPGAAYNYGQSALNRTEYLAKRSVLFAHAVMAVRREDQGVDVDKFNEEAGQ